MNKASFILVIAAFAATLTGGCTSTSTKNLTEDSSHNLIKEYTRSQNQGLTVPLGNVLRLMRRTLVDYTSSSASGKGADAVLKRLLDRKFVVQHSEPVMYPGVSGRFVGKGNGNVMDEYDLTMTPNSNAITGTKAEGVTGHKPDGTALSYAHHHLTGTVEANGRVTWAVDCCGYFTNRWQYSEDGNAAYLQSLGGMGSASVGYRLTGTASHQSVEVKWYEYAFTPEVQKLIVGTGWQASIPVGSYEIGEVSDLRLLIDTRAHAKFAWRGQLNDIGNAFLGDGAKSAGTGDAGFVKKPDGTWFVDHVRYD